MSVLINSVFIQQLVITATGSLLGCSLHHYHWRPLS